MLRLSMGVDLEATVDPDVEEPEEKEEEEKEKEGEEVEAEAEEKETSEGAAATETTEESKEDEVEVMKNRNTGHFVLVTCQLYYFKLAYKLFMYILESGSLPTTSLAGVLRDRIPMQLWYPVIIK